MPPVTTVPRASSGATPGPATGTTPSAGVWTVRIIGLVVAAAMVAAGATALVGGFFEQSRSRSTTTPVQAVSRLVVDVETGNVTVRSEPAGQPVRVTRTLHWAFGQPVSDVAVESGTLRVTGRCPSALQVGGYCSVDVDVAVPADLPVEIATTSGDISLADLGGAISVRTTGGDVSGTGLRSPDVDVRTTVGDVSATFTAPPSSLTVDATTGDVHLALPGAPNTYAVGGASSVGSRDVSVANDPASTHRLDVTTTLGDVTIAPAS